MIKRVFAFLLASLVLFFVVILISNKPIVHAQTCAGFPDWISVKYGGSTLIEGRLKISADAPDSATYTLRIEKGTLLPAPQVYSDSKFWGGDPEKKGDVFFYVDLVKPTFEEDQIYNARVQNDASPVKCGEILFTVRAPNPVQFTDPPLVLNYGFTRLEKIRVVGLEAGAVYKFELDKQWKKDEINEVGSGGRGKEFTASDEGVVTVRAICDNGDAHTTDEDDPCEDKFRVGRYIIRIRRASDGHRLNEMGFDVEVNLDEVEGEEKNIDLEAGEIATPFGIIQGTPEGLAQAFLSLGVGAAGGVAFLLMVFGAYRLMFAGGNPESIQEGRQVITAAIVGLIVVILAVFLLNLLGISILGLDIL